MANSVDPDQTVATAALVIQSFIQQVNITPMKKKSHEGVTYFDQFTCISVWCYFCSERGAVARSNARQPGIRTVTGSILTSGKTLFR